jgi:transmembrane sensor
MNPTAGDDEITPLGAPMDEALAWFARLRNGRIDPAERSAFETWRSADPEHAEAYARAERLWKSQELSAALARFAEEAMRPPTRRRCHLRPRRWAAAATILLLVGWSLLASGIVHRWRADYTTLAGEQRHITLTDGSSLTLNTDSALALDFSEAERAVRLLSGEAYFEVAPDSARPFVVRAGAASIRVVGTRFSVSAGDETTVKVESGVVACSSGRGESVEVRRGQQLGLSSGGIASPVPFDTNRAFAWLKGRLLFKDQPLAQVLAEVDRYHPGAIFIANPVLARTPVTGNYKLGDTAAIVRSLAEATGGHVSAVSKYLIIVR